MQILRELYEQALDLPADERGRWLDQHCDDSIQRARILALLQAAQVNSTGLLDRSAADRIAAFDVDASDSNAHWIGRRVGAFRLHQLIGQGGMALVFLATREDADFQQQVAIKLLHRGLFSEIEQKLFRRERQALASLSHPHIARLIDGGIAEGGVPYLAMEYVDGVSITRHCAQQRSDLGMRLKLFATVCRAVEAAHQALIVHRDIKPSNILVTSDGSVKLLDFGIAKLLLSDDDSPTRTGLTPLTPEYAAPEQFGGGPITTATDVYALGILLYELLLGERPQRDNTQKPSMHVGLVSTDLAALPAAPHSLRRLLKGDLDNIVMKALELEPQRRYASAGAMADDIERHLQGQPVAAHPPSPWYRTRKFIRRHRGGVAVTALLVLGILASLGAALWQGRVARQEAARANTVRDFMVDLLRRTTPATAQSERPDVPTLVYMAATALPSELIDQPETRVELLFTLGNVLRHMRDYERSEKLLVEAARLAAAMPINDRLRIVTELELARTLLRKGDLDAASTHLNPLLKLEPRLLPADVPRSMLLKVAMAIDAQTGRSASAVATGQLMLEAYRSDCAAGLRCSELAYAESDFASVLAGAGAFPAARDLLVTALQRKRSTGASVGSIKDTLITESAVAMLLGDLDFAERKAREADALAATLGNSLSRPDTAGRVYIADVLLAQERAAQAVELLQSVLTIRKENNASTCASNYAQALLGRALLLQQQWDSAIATSERARDSARRCARPWEKTPGRGPELTMARALAANGRKDEADAIYRRLLAQDPTLKSGSPFSRIPAIADTMRLALALGARDAAVVHADQLLALLDSSEVLRNAPLRLEAEIVLYRWSAVRAGTAMRPRPKSALIEALGKMPRWPVAARLQQELSAPIEAPFVRKTLTAD